MASASNPLGTSPSGTDTISSTRTNSDVDRGFRGGGRGRAVPELREGCSNYLLGTPDLLFDRGSGFGAAILCGIRYRNENSDWLL
jgi:hypothetical protein